MNKDKFLQRYLDGELSPEEEKQALHEIAEDEELRSMLRFEQQFNEMFVGKSFDFDPDIIPENFTEQVMHRIPSNGKKESRSIFRQVKTWFRFLWVPRQLQWRPIDAFLVMMIAGITLGYSIYGYTILQNNDLLNAVNRTTNYVNGSVQQISASEEMVTLRFVYIDNSAHSIAVAGDFNNWEPAEMRKREIDGKRVWTGLVSVARGEHHYMFVKNGDQWMTDPLASVLRDDGFGNKNAVLYL